MRHRHAAVFCHYPYLHVTASTVEVLIEGARVGFLARERGHHVAWVVALGKVLGLDDDAACTAPRLAGLVGELIKYPAGVLGVQDTGVGR